MDAVDREVPAVRVPHAAVRAGPVALVVLPFLVAPVELARRRAVLVGLPRARLVRLAARVRALAVQAPRAVVVAAWATRMRSILVGLVTRT